MRSRGRVRLGQAFANRGAGGDRVTRVLYSYLHLRVIMAQKSP